MRHMLALLFLGLAALASPAAAQSTGELSGSARSRLALDVGFYHGGSDTLLGAERRTILVPSLHLSADVLGIAPDVSLALDVSFRAVGSIWKVGSNERTDFRPGNVYAGLRLVVTPFEGLRVRGGLGVVAPVLNTYAGDDFAVIAVPFTALPLGGWDPWLIARGYVPVVLRLDAELRQGAFFLGAEGAIGLGVPVLEGYEGLALGAQLAGFGGVRPIQELALGLRAQTAMYDAGRTAGVFGSDPWAVGFFSLVPFVRVEVGGLFAEARCFVSLVDNPAYAANGEKAWGLYLLLGTDFDLR
ncbi:MAG: hypothetical protein ACK6CU_05310 [Deltaproteobacteria bacterium]|jgi:hypothetical protein